MTDRPEDPSNSKEIDPELPAAPEPESEAMTDVEPEPEPEPEPTDDEIDADVDASDDADDEATDDDADDEATDDDAEATDDATDVIPGAAIPTGARRRGTAPVKPRAPTLSEIAVHVNEPWSKIFVIAAIAVFVAIMLNGLLLGKGGLLTSTASPQPSPSAIASPSTAPSASPAASASAVPSGSASSAPSVSPSP